MNGKLVLGIAVGMLVLAILACGPIPSPTSAPTSPPPTARPTEVSPTATPQTGGEEGGGKAGPAEPSPTPPSAGEPGGGKGGGGSTGRPAMLTLYNDADIKVCYVYISPTTEDTWGDDWLGAEETIAPGGSREFEVPAGTYDLRADDCDHNILDEQYGVSIAGTLGWTVAGEAANTVIVTLYNNSGQTVCYVYISPSTEDSWGDDWLGSSETVASGDSREFEVAVGTYDVMARDCQRNALDDRRGVALSDDWDWTISPVGGSATLTVINDTDIGIWYVYISPSTSTEWGDDWLGSDTIPPGSSYTFDVTEGTYDLKAEDSAHNVIATLFGEYISGDMEWRLYPEGGGSSLTLVNNSNRTVCYVYISPSTSSEWGDDWLGASETLSPGDSRTFYLEAGTYDLKAEDCNHEVIASEFQQNISGDMTWTIR